MNLRNFNKRRGWKIVEGNNVFCFFVVKVLFRVCIRLGKKELGLRVKSIIEESF